MIKKQFILACALAVSASALTGCSDDDNPTTGGSNNGTSCGPQFVIATTVSSSGNNSYVLLTAPSLDEGSVSPLNNGCTNEGATQWIYNGNHVYGLTYAQGNDGMTKRFVLRPDGKIEADRNEFSISRFSSYGIAGDYIISMATADGHTNFAANGYTPKTLTFTRIDCVNGTATENNTIASNQYSLENYVGTGEYVTLCGIEPVGNKIFSGVIPMGLSQYGYADGNGKWLRSEEYRDLVATEDGGTGGGSYKKGELSGTQYPDACHVAIYNNKDLLNPTIVSTNQISSPAGRFRSQYYQSIWADEKGDVYVFSPSYGKTATNSLQRTTVAAGVMRIKSGTEAFDDSYYYDIEALSGGYSFMRNWYISNGYFLMQMYDQKLTASTSGGRAGGGGGKTSYTALTLAIFDAYNGTYKKVSLPSNVSEIGKTIYAQNGYVYIPVSFTEGYPVIYRIDPKTATATKGLTIEATSIQGIGLLSPIAY